MPTIYPPKLVETPSAWRMADHFLEELCKDGVAILRALNFYEERDLKIPHPNADLSEEERAELGSIAGTLAMAAEASAVMPDGVLLASLKKKLHGNPCFSARTTFQPKSNGQ